MIRADTQCSCKCATFEWTHKTAANRKWSKVKALARFYRHVFSVSCSFLCVGHRNSFVPIARFHRRVSNAWPLHVFIGMCSVAYSFLSVEKTLLRPLHVSIGVLPLHGPCTFLSACVPLHVPSCVCMWSKVSKKLSPEIM